MLYVVVPTLLAIGLIIGLVARERLFFEQPETHISYDEGSTSDGKP